MEMYRRKLVKHVVDSREYYLVNIPSDLLTRNHVDTCKEVVIVDDEGKITMVFG